MCIRDSTGADPVLLEVFNNLYMSIAEQMGEALRLTAQSVNIKERLDFSCAVFNREGRLVATASGTFKYWLAPTTLSSKIGAASD